MLFIGSMLWTDQAFAQMESIRITGNQYPEIDTFFNINIIVEGISRSSGGLFDIQGTIYEKDNPNWHMNEFVKDVYSGTNTVKIDNKTKGTMSARNFALIERNSRNFRFTSILRRSPFANNLSSEGYCGNAVAK